MNQKKEDQTSSYSETNGFEQKIIFSPEIAHTALDYLATFPVVNGDETQRLVSEFHVSAARVAASEQETSCLYELLAYFNPNFIPKEYSKDDKANILANVVAAIYAPLIHNFNLSLLTNIGNGALPNNVLAPPRDTIPFVNSLQLHSAKANIPVLILQPYINRHTAGIANNQVLKDPKESPHLKLHLAQFIENLKPGQSFAEIEPGIYSTLSLKVSKMLKELGHTNLAAVKFYGLGPNLSYVHAVLSDGQEWVAEEAEKKGLVDPKQIAELMILLDSMEEFGMQNSIESVEELIIDAKGRVVPLIVESSKVDQEIATATNKAVIDTAKLYTTHNPTFVKELLSKVPQMAIASEKLGLPLTLSSIIPPDDKSVKLAHFDAIRKSELLHYPKGMTL